MLSHLELTVYFILFHFILFKVDLIDSLVSWENGNCYNRIGTRINGKIKRIMSSFSTAVPILVLD